MSHLLVRTIVYTTLLAFSYSCVSNRKSGRDLRQEQIRNNASIKRKELANVMGTYQGVLKSRGMTDKPVTLMLEVADVSHDVDEVDPILVPTLKGYLRFTYGEQTPEVISFALKNSSYNAKDSHLDLEFENSVYKDLVFELDLSKSQATGKWLASGSSVSGTLSLNRTNEEAAEDTASIKGQNPLSGRYVGQLVTKDRQTTQTAVLNLTSSILMPDSLSLQASVQLYLNDESSQEYVTYYFDQVRFNPVTGTLNISDKENRYMTFEGAWINEQYSGAWTQILNSDRAKGKFVFLNQGGDE